MIPRPTRVKVMDVIGLSRTDALALRQQRAIPNATVAWRFGDDMTGALFDESCTLVLAFRNRNITSC